MRIVAIVQARMRSARLPAKVLLDLGGQTALQRCLDRVGRIAGVAEVIVATSTTTQDDVIELAAGRLGYRVCRGSEHDVLARYADAARAIRADAIVRCTADCPLLDPDVSALAVRTFADSQGSVNPLDYVSNTIDRRLPRGLDTEVLRTDALLRANEDATNAAEREHVTMFIYRRPMHFSLRFWHFRAYRPISHSIDGR